MRSRLLALTTLTLLLAALLPITSVFADAHCSRETNQCVDPMFQSFYDANDGVNRFGMPLSQLIWTLVDNEEVQVQWFERVRLERHPAGITLGRLGVELAAVEDHHFTEADAPQAGCKYFADMRHNVCGLFLKYWLGAGISGMPADAGRIALWGKPISEEQIVSTDEGLAYTVQWFERARLEDYGEAGVNVAMLSRDLHADYTPAPTATPKPRPNQPPPTTAPRSPNQPAPTPAPNVPSTPTFVGGFANGDFEQGAKGWDILDDGNIAQDAKLAHGGQWYAQLGGSRDRQETIRQVVTIPANAPYLSYWYRSVSEQANCEYDGAGIWVKTDINVVGAGDMVDGLNEFCHGSLHLDYQHRTVDLSAYAGKSVQIDFTMITNAGYASYWCLDDIGFQTAP